jgi:hypothetical protein
MFSARRLFEVFSVVLVLLASAVSPAVVTAQSLSEIRSLISSPQRCHDLGPIRMTRMDRYDRQFSGSETLPAGEFCDESAVTEAALIIHKDNDTPVPVHSADSHGERPDFTIQPGATSSIRASGSEAATIARARAAVLDILRGNNACSAWFSKSDSNVVETFSSLQFWIERDGPNHIVKERGDRGDWVEHGPYIARTSQSTGKDTNIAINANGAFFRAKAEVFKIEWHQSYELPTNVWQILHAGPYDGATGKAQIVTLLHELAHVVGAIPSDGLSPSGLNRSHENTEEVLRQCKNAVDASTKHAIFELVQKLPE